MTGPFPLIPLRMIANCGFSFGLGVTDMPGFQSWWPLARYSHWDAARNGKRDGQHGIPEDDQQKQPAYILQLKQLGEENIERLAQSWKKRDSIFLADYCKAKSEVEELGRSLQKAEQEALKAKDEERRLREEYSKHFHVTPFWYRVMIGAIAVLEVPLNSIVFQLFGEAQLLTILMSIGIGIMLPLCAHLVGGLLRHGFLRTGKIATETWIIVTLVLAAIGTLAGIAYLREKFFEGSGVQKLLGLSMDYTTVTLIFFVINLLIFVVATAAAYVAHDPIATIHLLELKAARKLRRNAEKKVKLTEERLQQTQAELHEVGARRQKTFEQTRHEVDEIRNIVQRLISVYEQHNQRHRGSAKKPLCFEHYPEINTRDPLLDPHNGAAHLEWECQNLPATASILPLTIEAREEKEVV
jgi:hypothetical protein